MKSAFNSFTPQIFSKGVAIDNLFPYKQAVSTVILYCLYTYSKFSIRILLSVTVDATFNTIYTDDCNRFFRDYSGKLSEIIVDHQSKAL